MRVQFCAFHHCHWMATNAQKKELALLQISDLFPSHHHVSGPAEAKLIIRSHCKVAGRKKGDDEQQSEKQRQLSKLYAMQPSQMRTSVVSQLTFCFALAHFNLDLRWLAQASRTGVPTDRHFNASICRITEHSIVNRLIKYLRVGNPVLRTGASHIKSRLNFVDAKQTQIHTERGKDMPLASPGFTLTRQIFLKIINC